MGLDVVFVREIGIDQMNVGMFSKMLVERLVVFLLELRTSKFCLRSCGRTIAKNNYEMAAAEMFQLIKMKTFRLFGK